MQVTPRLALVTAGVAAVVVGLAVIVALNRRHGSPPPADAVTADARRPVDAADPVDAAPPIDASAHCPSLTCDCEDGTQLTSIYMINGRCADRAKTCGEGCKAHDGVKGAWDPARGLPTGKHCAHDLDCDSKLCVKGRCSKRCDSFADCPATWDCVAKRCEPS